MKKHLELAYNAAFGSEASEKTVKFWEGLGCPTDHESQMPDGRMFWVHPLADHDGLARMILTTWPDGVWDGAPDTQVVFDWDGPFKLRTHPDKVYIRPSFTDDEISGYGCWCSADGVQEAHVFSTQEEAHAAAGWLHPSCKFTKVPVWPTEVKIINLTPHAVNVEGHGSFPSEGSVRLDQHDTPGTNLDGIPVVIRSYGDGNLPPVVDGIAYIVSQIVAAAFPARRDFYYPGDLVRDESGNITGCKGLAQVPAN